MKKIIHFIRPWAAPAGTDLVDEDGRAFELFISDNEPYTLTLNLMSTKEEREKR